jgi:hypothetical protein
VLRAFDVDVGAHPVGDLLCGDRTWCTRPDRVNCARGLGVLPSRARVRCGCSRRRRWVPAFAGTTGEVCECECAGAVRQAAGSRRPPGRRHLGGAEDIDGSRSDACSVRLLEPSPSRGGLGGDGVRSATALALANQGKALGLGVRRDDGTWVRRTSMAQVPLPVRVRLHLSPPLQGGGWTWCSLRDCAGVR